MTTPADVKISALPSDSSPASTDILPFVDETAGTTKYMTIAALSALIQSLNPSTPSGVMIPSATPLAPSGWTLCFGQTVSRASFASLFAAVAPAIGTFTITLASPGVVTLSSHGLLTGDQVYLTTTGALPTGLSSNTLYYVLKLDANTFSLCTSRANAYAGTKINTSGSQSGVHTLTWCPWGLGDGSTTFTLPDMRGRAFAGADGIGGTAASRLTLAQTQGVYGNHGAAGGEQGHTIVTAELASHVHNLNSAAAAGGDGSGHAWSSTSLNASTGVSSTGSDTAHNNVQPTALGNWIIKQ